jgi:hypothetical protein
VVLALPPLATPVRRGYRFLAIFRWWHLLSLDAPTVAALWSWTFARSMGVNLPWTAPLLLALGTWLVYVADRILDGLLLAPPQLRERHFFYARHRAGTLITAAFATLALLWLIFTRMNPAARREDIVLFLAALAYFGLIHVWAPRSTSGIERWFPKELAVAFVFACAVAVPAWSRLTVHRTSLIPLVSLFALLCWLNCVAIEKWEGWTKWEQSLPGRMSVSQPLQSHSSTRWAQHHLAYVACGIAVLAAIGSTLSLLSATSLSTAPLYLACALSALLFLAFDRSHLDALDLRIAADLALLTPLLFIPAFR